MVVSPSTGGNLSGSEEEGEVSAEVTAEGAVDVIGEGGFLLDVREQSEWNAGHAPEATHIPLGQIGDRIGELPTDRPIVCVCHLGGRSARATEALREKGLDASNLVGGMVAWAAADLPVIDADGAPGIVV